MENVEEVGKAAALECHKAQVSDWAGKLQVDSVGG
jgi:hypothetical protein